MSGPLDDTIEARIAGMLENATDHDDHEAQARHLTSANPRERLSARCAVSGWPDQVRDWVAAERDRRENPVDILYTLANLQVQVFASVAAALIKPGGYDDLADLYGKMAAEKLADHARMVHTMQAKRGGTA